jgi:hypothetical protein
MKLFLLIVGLSLGKLFAADTLCTHPVYPPLVYEGDDYRFYKYTARYIPENIWHSFKILATCGDEKLIDFANRSEEEVIEHGMFRKGYRMRKEFCLEGYSSFAYAFHRNGIYYPYAMKTFILLSFHQYLNKHKIKWRYNKVLALEGRRDLNKAWKKRLKHAFEPVILEEEPAAVKNTVVMDPIEEQFYNY